MNDTGIISRLEQYLEIDGATTNSFANKVGIDPGNLRKMLAGKQRITDKTLWKIADAHNLNFEWLKYGEGEMYAVDEPAPEISYTDGVPYFDVDFKLGFDEMEHPGAPNPEYLIRMPGYEKATLWCNASGHSMEPEISNGDIIALQKIEDISFLPFGAVYAIITTNGMRTIKRLGRSEMPGCYKLIPTNPEYDSQDIPIKMIYRVYRVMGSMKTF